MYYTYILKSLKDGKYYYGHTAGLSSRLKEHNNGKVRATKGRRPFIIHYFETFATKPEAIKRELFFKSIDGYIFLKQEKIIWSDCGSEGLGFSRRDSLGGTPLVTHAKTLIFQGLFYCIDIESFIIMILF